MLNRKFNLGESVEKAERVKADQKAHGGRQTLENLIEEADLFGFTVRVVEPGVYTQTAACNHCSKLFTDNLVINMQDQYVKSARFEVYCPKCREKRR